MSLRPRHPRAALAGGIGFLALAGLVAAGAFTWLDQYAVSHLMPWLQARSRSQVTVSSLTLPSLGHSAGRALVDLWTYPAAFVPSLVLVLVCAWRLHARGCTTAAVTWCALWLAGNAVELLGKLRVERPALHRGAVHVTSFDHSLPSGHTIRSLVVAGAIAWTWRRGGLAFAWAAGVPFALVALGAHTPTDVAAGVLVAVALAGFLPTPTTSRRD